MTGQEMIPTRRLFAMPCQHQSPLGIGSCTFPATHTVRWDQWSGHYCVGHAHDVAARQRNEGHHATISQGVEL